MKYMGSKARFAKDIVPFLLEKLKSEKLDYVEPFCGGCNLIDKIPKIEGQKIANDLNTYLIAMWRGLQQGKLYPMQIDKEFYSDVRDSYNKQDGRYSDDMIGWVGFMASFNGRFFDGGYSGHNVRNRDYIREQIRNTTSQLPQLKSVQFISGNYSEIKLTNKSLIYCDPPYRGTKPYKYYIEDYDAFWDWCREKSKEGHYVFVSEYAAPSDFKCVWEKAATTAINPNKTLKATEKLFTI